MSARKNCSIKSKPPPKKTKEQKHPLHGGKKKHKEKKDALPPGEKIPIKRKKRQHRVKIPIKKNRQDRDKIPIKKKKSHHIDTFFSRGGGRTSAYSCSSLWVPMIHYT